MCFILNLDNEDIKKMGKIKNGLVVCKGTGYYKNIGDYIQNLAAEIFFDKIDVYVEREELSSYNFSEDKVKVIMNGWYMWRPENFPPGKDLEPFFISFHIVPDIADKMLTPKSIEYLKKNSPIGCRDTGTMEILKQHGIPCYFSGCLTLVLGERYKSEKKSGEFLFVDPYYEWFKLSKKGIYIPWGAFFSSILTLFTNLSKIRKLIKIFKCDSPLGKYEKFDFLHLDKWLQASIFYKIYSKNFEDEVLLNADYIVHNIPQKNFKNENEKFDYARALMRRYAEAELIITSRIHCALPALAVETPVIFVTSTVLETKSNVRSRGRFGGMLNLFRVMEYTKNKLTTEDEILKEEKGKIGLNTKIYNKTDYQILKADLLRRCTEFVSGD